MQPSCNSVTPTVCSSLSASVTSSPAMNHWFLAATSSFTNQMYTFLSQEKMASFYLGRQFFSKWFSCKIHWIEWKHPLVSVHGECYESYVTLCYKEQVCLTEHAGWDRVSTRGSEVHLLKYLIHLHSFSDVCHLDFCSQNTWKAYKIWFFVFNQTISMKIWQYCDQMIIQSLPALKFFVFICQKKTKFFLIFM